MPFNKRPTGAHDLKKRYGGTKQNVRSRNYGAKHVLTRPLTEEEKKERKKSLPLLNKERINNNLRYLHGRGLLNKQFYEGQQNSQ